MRNAQKFLSVLTCVQTARQSSHSDENGAHAARQSCPQVHIQWRRGNNPTVRRSLCRRMSDDDTALAFAIIGAAIAIQQFVSVQSAVAELTSLLHRAVTAREKRTLWLNWFNLKYDLSAAGFRDTFRMDQTIFEELLSGCMVSGKMPRPCYQPLGLHGNRLNPGTALGMTLFYLAQGPTLRGVESQLGYSASHCHYIIGDTLLAIIACTSKTISIAQRGDNAMRESIKWCEGERYGALAGCVMAVDGTHVPFRFVCFCPLQLFMC